MSAGAWTSTACILCECNCGLEVQLDGRRLARFRGDERHPSSRGYACEKPHRLDHYQNGRDRLTTPLRRTPSGDFEPIDWDTAIREVAQRLAAVRDTHGGDTIFYYGGGGQGNHLPGAYATATRRSVGCRYRSSPLAQEKTGEFWVSHRMMGAGTRADFEHCDVALFLGKNPWHSHSIPRARVTLKAIAQDPARTLIVIDPRRTETAELADIHLAPVPGTDAWLLLAILGVLREEGLIDRAFVDARVAPGELEPVLEALARHSIAESCARTGIDEALVRKAARAMGQARALASFEDLGVQMNHHSTVVSYLHRLLIVLTGSFGKPGTHFVPTTLVDIANGEAKRTSPVAGAPHHLRADALQCHPGGDPDRPPAPLPGDDRGERRTRRTPWPTAPGCARRCGAGVSRGHRHRHERDGAPGRLCVAGGLAVREVGDDVLQPGVPAQHLHLPAPPAAAAAGHAARGRDPPAAGAGAGRLHGRRSGAAARRRRLIPEQGRGAFAMAFMGTVAHATALMALAPVILYETLGPTLARRRRGRPAAGARAQSCAMSFPDA
jgi:hypothetical protein